MEFTIKSKRVHRHGAPILFKRTSHQNAGFQPEGIVVHDTAGRLDRYSSVNWFLNPEAKASAHFVVERDGEVVQLADLDRRCWHCGKSTYKGRANVNEFAFGIEIVNMGKLERSGDNRFKTWFKREYFQGEDGLQFVHKQTTSHGSGFWHDYTEAQIAAVIGLCSALKKQHGIQWITTHWHISPGRKVDTNPLFPLEEVRAAVMGLSEELQEGPSRTIASVNQRRWPSLADNVIQVIPKGAEVTVIRQGLFTNEGQEALWYLVSYGGHEGWVHSGYLD